MAGASRHRRGAAPRSRPWRRRARCSARRSTAGRPTRWSRSSATASSPRRRRSTRSRPGRDLAPGDTAGVLLSEPAAAPARRRASATPSRWSAGSIRRSSPPPWAARLVVRGMVRWLYDYRGQPSVGTVLPVMQRLARQTAERSRLAHPGEGSVRTARSPALAARLRRRLPQVEVNSVADLVAQFRERLVYFRQLSYILGSMSLIVTVLLIATLLTITVNERLGEIATLRAIGVSRATVVRQVLAEGTALTLVGAALGILLGLATARYLDAILTSFPGLPAAFSFFVPRADTLAFAALVLLVTGIARRALSRVARRARADRRHAARGGDVSRAAAASPASSGRTTR